MKTLLCSALLGAGLIAGALFLAFTIDDSPILFESRESKTAEGGLVYSRVRKISQPGKTIWMMQQSHHGIRLPSEKWDRLAIVVSHATSTATYHQLESGPLEWKEGLPEKPLRVACYLCHANGPRAVRPNFASAAAPVSWKNQARLALWNLGVKAAGRISPSPLEAMKDHSSRAGGMPFRFPDAEGNKPLTVKTCSRCHREGGWPARGTLTRQQGITIRFLVEEGFMPPPGFALNAQEKQELARILSQ
jgi:hypothetical protein